MEKTRVKKGEKYWRIWAMDTYFVICDSVDDYGEVSTKMYEMGNYFFNKESAEAMAAKLRAVLKGAEVIETPSKEEI